MEWIRIGIEIFLGTLFPSIVLWLIGKKVQYDFEFWKLLVINFSAACVDQIPYAGMWLSIVVYYGLFVKLTGIDFIEAIWMSFLAFLVYAALGFALLMYGGHLFSLLGQTDGADSYTPIEQYEPDVENSIEFPEEESAPLPVITNIAPSAVQNAPDWITQKYNLSGTAVYGNEKRAIINNEIAYEGQMLEAGVTIQRIEKDSVLIQAKDEIYRLEIPASFPLTQ